MPGIGAEIDHQTVGEGQDISVVGAGIGGKAIGLERVRQPLVEEGGGDAVAVNHRHDGDLDSLDGPLAAETQYLDLFRRAAGGDDLLL